MLAWLSKSKHPSISGLTMFGCGYWLDSGCLALLCVSLWPLVSCGNHAQLGGGSDAEILKSTLAYGWMEHYSDIAGCGTSFFQDKYSLVFYFRNYNFFMNDYEHVECLNK